MPAWDKLVFAAILGLSGYDTHSKSEIADQLHAMQTVLVEISKSLAVAVTKIEEHDRRIGNLEAYQRNK